MCAWVPLCTGMPWLHGRLERDDVIAVRPESICLWSSSVIIRPLFDVSHTSLLFSPSRTTVADGRKSKPRGALSRSREHKAAGRVCPLRFPRGQGAPLYHPGSPPCHVLPLVPSLALCLWTRLLLCIAFSLTIFLPVSMSVCLCISFCHYMCFHLDFSRLTPRPLLRYIPVHELT